MVTRRGLLQGCVALAAAAATRDAVARPMAPDDVSSIRITTLVVDATTGGGAQIRRAADLAGALVLDAGADLAPVLYGILVRHWRDAPAYAVAGLTSAASLYYLERVAYDFGLRTVFVSCHRGSDPGWHWINGPESMRDAFAARARIEDWRTAAVATSLRVPAEARPLGSAQAHLAPEMMSDGALFGWALVPRAGAARPVTREPRT